MRSVSSEVKTEKEKEKIPIQKEDIIWALKQLVWVMDETLRTTERYFQAQIRYLRAKDLDVITTTRLIPLEKGMRLEIEISIPDETILFFAQNQGALSRLIRDKRISIRKAKIIRETKKTLGGVVAKIGSSKA